MTAKKSDLDRIADRLERQEMRKRLRDAEAAFKERGGRGVELAEEIDYLRSQLGIKGVSA